jgi:hypothetical protein
LIAMMMMVVVVTMVTSMATMMVTMKARMTLTTRSMSMWITAGISQSVPHLIRGRDGLGSCCRWKGHQWDLPGLN